MAHTKDTNKVIPAFLAGTAINGVHASGGMGGFEGVRLSTDGKTLWSYKMAIAKRVISKGKIVIKLLPYADMPTNTTRRHHSALRTALYDDATRGEGLYAVKEVKSL